MKVLLLTISCFVALPLVADEQLEQLDQRVTQTYRNQEYNASIAHATELLQAAKDKDDIFYIVRSYLIMGFLYSKTEEFGKAVLSYLEGARFAENSSDKKVKESLITIYKNLGVIMGDYNHFDLAHKFSQKGLKVAVDIEDKAQVIDLLHYDGYKYVEEKKYASAINVFQHILTEYQPDFRKEVGLKNDLGIAYRNLGRLNEAINQYQAILDLHDSIQDIRLIGKVRHNLGLALMDKREYEKALTYFEAASEVNIKGGFTNSLFGNYKYTGLCLYNLGRKDEAIEYYLKAESLFNEEYVDPEDYDIFELIANFYHTYDQPELALHYENLYDQHLEAFEETRAAMQLPAELLLQVRDLLNENETLDLRTRQVIIAVSAVVILLGFSFVYLYRRTKKKKSPEPKPIDPDRQLMTRHELAHKLGISYHTLWRRLQQSNLKVSSRKYLSPTEQEEIINHLNGKG